MEQNWYSHSMYRPHLPLFPKLHLTKIWELLGADEHCPSLTTYANPWVGWPVPEPTHSQSSLTLLLRNQDQVVGKYLCCLIQIVQKGLFVSVWPFDVWNDHQNNFVPYKFLNPPQKRYVLPRNTIDRPRCLSSASIKNLVPVESNDGLWSFVCIRIKELPVTVKTLGIGLECRCSWTSWLGTFSLVISTGALTLVFNAWSASNAFCNSATPHTLWKQMSPLLPSVGSNLRLAISPPRNSVNAWITWPTLWVLATIFFGQENIEIQLTRWAPTSCK